MIPITTLGNAVTPSSAWLNVNRECNLRCSWCYAKGTEYKREDEMTLALAKRLMKISKPLGVKSVTLIGGEPTLWEPLLEFNHYCEEVGIRTTLVTNGTRFGTDSFWSRYLDSPCSNVSLSIKAFDEESFRCTTHTKSFATTKLGIERALSLSVARASLVYTGADIEELPKLGRFAVECGAKTLGISPSAPTFIKGKAEILNATDPRLFIPRFIRHYEELDEMFQGQISLAIKLPLCLWPRDFIVRMIERSQITTTCQLQHRSGILFTPNGSMISCNSLHDFPIGQLEDDFDNVETLGAHLKSAGVRHFYDRMTTYASHKCVTCSVRQFCGGGCPLFYGILDGVQTVPGWD